MCNIHWLPLLNKAIHCSLPSTNWIFIPNGAPIPLVFCYPCQCQSTDTQKSSLSSKLLLSARQNLQTKRCHFGCRRTTGERVLLHCFGDQILLKRVVSMVTAIQSCKHPPCKMIFVPVKATKAWRGTWFIGPLVVNFTFRPFYPQ